ncbi:MAG: hypothetical protein GY835_13455 [bacterium]|nr:hypothetical protein [bacterium]
MKRLIQVLGLMLLFAMPACAAEEEEFVEKRDVPEIKEFTFIGYYFMRSEMGNVAPTNEFLKGQVVGRIFGGNTTNTSDKVSRFTEQRFLPMITYSPRLFNGWAKMRMAFEFDWTWGDANYGAGGNFGGAYGADFVNMQTQNLFIEFRPRKNIFINAGLLRLYDNVRVPYYTFKDDLTYKGYRLSLFGSDATGISAHWFFAQNQRVKAGVYQLYENNVEHDDDVNLFELDYERDLDIDTSVGMSVHAIRDHANGEGGVSVLGQGLNSSLSNYNGVGNFDLGSEDYKANVFWLGSHFHSDPLLKQGRFGWSGFAIWNTGSVTTATRDISINGLAANLRIARRWGTWHEDQISWDCIFTTGDKNGSSDDTYNGFLTGNNWTAPGAVFISHGLYLLLPHGNVVNRFNAATTDIQNIGLGLEAASLSVSKELVPNKWKIKAAVGHGRSFETKTDMGSTIGTELNLNLRYRPKVFMDLELHAAYLWLGDFYDSPEVNGGVDYRPDNPWTIFATVKWIMF